MACGGASRDKRGPLLTSSLRVDPQSFLRVLGCDELADEEGKLTQACMRCNPPLLESTDPEIHPLPLSDARSRNKSSPMRLIHCYEDRRSMSAPRMIHLCERLARSSSDIQMGRVADNTSEVCENPGSRELDVGSPQTSKRLILGLAAGTLRAGFSGGPDRWTRRARRPEFGV